MLQEELQGSPVHFNSPDHAPIPMYEIPPPTGLGEGVLCEEIESVEDDDNADGESETEAQPILTASVNRRQIPHHDSQP